MMMDQLTNNFVGIIRVLAEPDSSPSDAIRKMMQQAGEIAAYSNACMPSIEYAHIGDLQKIFERAYLRVAKMLGRDPKKDCHTQTI